MEERRVNVDDVGGVPLEGNEPALRILQLPLQGLAADKIAIEANEILVAQLRGSIQ